MCYGRRLLSGCKANVQIKGADGHNSAWSILVAIFMQLLHLGALHTGGWLGNRLGLLRSSSKAFICVSQIKKFAAAKLSHQETPGRVPRAGGSLSAAGAWQAGGERAGVLLRGQPASFPILRLICESCGAHPSLRAQHVPRTGLAAPQCPAHTLTHRGEPAPLLCSRCTEP